MTATPWGEAERLALRKLKPGPGTSREEVVRNQRERLMGAMVAVVAERGYEATRVQDVLDRSGVSRNSFYKLFSSKQDCFVATLEEIAKLGKAMVRDAFEGADGPWDRKLAAILDSLAATIEAQPAMARVAWVEYYAAGPEAIAVIEGIDRTVESIIVRTLRHCPKRAGLPRAVIRATVGCVRKIVHTRVREGRERELRDLMPQLFEWMQSYHTPPVRLARPRTVPKALRTPRPEPRDGRERIIAAMAELVAEKGYPAVAITEIADRGAVSLTTFYDNFEGKEAALLATLADAQQQLFAAVLPHFQRSDDWAESVAAAGRAFAAFLSTNPTLASFGGVGVWAATPATLELRAQGLAMFSALLEEGFRQYPDTNAIAYEAIGATLDLLLFETILHKGPERIYEIAPTAIFIALTPFVGVERACELANGEAVGVGA